MNKKITTLAIIGAIVLIAIALAFIPKDIMENYAIFVFVGALFIFIAVVGIAVYFNNKSSSEGKVEHKEHKPHSAPLAPKPKKKPSSPTKGSPRDRHLKGEKMPRKETKNVRALEKDREIIQNEIKIAEKKFLKHKIDNVTFSSVSQDANKRLIEIEAKIDLIKRQDLSGTKMRKMEYVSNDKQIVLEKLLDEKTSKIRQIKIAEKKFLKRQIDEPTYRKIRLDVDKEIISIGAQVKALQKANEVDKIKQQLKSSLAEVNKQKDLSKKRMEEQLEEDILEQLPFGR